MLRSKLQPPRLGTGRIEQPRLFSQLDRGLEGQFTLVAAPAGYGKTTLLAQWVQVQEMPTVGLWLEEGDDDPEFFLRALVSQNVRLNTTVLSVEALEAKWGSRSRGSR